MRGCRVIRQVRGTGFGVAGEITLALMLEALAAAFIADPFKVLLGGGGVLGLLTLVVKAWRIRAKPRIRLIEHTYYVHGGIKAEVEVEIENIGHESTSVDRVVKMTCLYPKMVRITADFQLEGDDRSLAPVVPRVFRIVGSPPASFIFSHFRVYTFRFTRGGNTRLRVLNASGQTVGALRFWFLKWLYVLTGALPHVNGGGNEG
jgi:hypothetical protein